MKFKENILNQVQIILKSVESIVSQMSNYPDSESNNYRQCQDEPLWWDNEDVNNKTFLNAQFDLYSSCEKSETMSECFVNSPASIIFISISYWYVTTWLVFSLSAFSFSITMIFQI